MAETVIQIGDYIAQHDFWDLGFVTPQSVREQLEAAEGDVRVEINSGGGSVFAGWEIVNLLESYNKGKVTTRITGMAASAAGQIFLAGERREVFTKTYFMAHPAWTILLGNQYELASEVDLLQQVDNVLIEDLSNLTGIEKDKMADLVRDVYNVIGKKIKEVGIATHLVKGTAEAPQVPAKDLDDDDKAQNCFRNQKVDKNLRIHNLHSSNLPEGSDGDENLAPPKTGIIASIKNILTNGGHEQVTESEANEMLARQAAENAEIIQRLEKEHQDAIQQERSRVAEIYQLAGGDLESAGKAVTENLSSGDFAKELVKKQQNEKSSWKDGSEPKNDKDFEEYLPDGLKDDSIGDLEKSFISLANDKAKEGGLV